jgi:hypothetical protein
MSEQTVSLAQWVFAAIVIIAVFIVMVATMYFHAKKLNFPQSTISLLKWLIKVLLCLFFALSVGASGLRVIGNFLK